MKNKFKIIKIFVFPAIILLIWLLFNFIIIPKICGNIILPYDCLFADPQNIIDGISDFNNANLDTGEIILIRIFEYILLLLFITSLFFAGKKLHTIPKSNTTRKDLYLMTQKIVNILRNKKTSIETKKLNNLIDDVKQLEERLFVESDFGYGNEIVIDCENDIKNHIEIILNLAKNIEDESYKENIKLISTEIFTINELLYKRTEFKKI